MTIEERGDQAALLKATGQCNCAQAVFSVYADKLPLTQEQLMQLGAGYAAGMGCTESTCGALIAAVAAAGLLTEGQQTMRYAARMVSSFETHCGATICKELKGLETGSLLCPCPECVRTAVLVLAEVLGLE